MHKSISLSFMTLSLFVINSRCFCHYSCICLCESFFFFVSMCLSAYYAVRPFLFMLMFAIMNLSLSLCFSSQLITPIFSVFRYLNLFAFVCPFGSQSLCLQSLSLFLCPCDEVYSLFLSSLSPLSLLSLSSLSPLSILSLSSLLSLNKLYQHLFLLITLFLKRWSILGLFLFIFIFSIQLLVNK